VGNAVDSRAPNTTAMVGPAPPILRVPLFPRLISVFAVVLLAGVSLFLAAIAVLVLPRQWALAVFVMAPVACFVAGLTGYVYRDLAGKWGLRVALGNDSVTLDLPSGRSLIHRPSAQHVTIPYGDIAAIETRLEAYRSLGMAMMQRAYMLRLRNGDMIFLFEDRALATSFNSSISAEMAAAIPARARIPVEDLGMIEGQRGVLGVWRTHPADWAAPALPLARQLWLWRHSAATGTLALAVVIIAFAIRLMVGGI
jgi:hypothetical protein